MSKEIIEKKYATNHYAYYPKGKFPIYLAYGFRPIFLLLAPYIIISIILWGLSFTGVLNLNFMNDTLTWHMYEMIFGIASAGIIAFFITGAPEMFPSVVPLVGRPLGLIVLLWFLGRISFWLIDYVGIYVVAFFNIPLIPIIIALIIKPLFNDPNKRHISLGFSLISISIIQILIFLSLANLVPLEAYDLLIFSLGLFIVLILLAIRRVNIEAINELLEQEGIDESFYARAPRYNLAIFCILLYSLIELFFPNNSSLAYLSFACSTSILALLNDFILKDNNILFKPFVMYMMSIIIMLALAYGFLGFDYLDEEIYALNHFRHFLTTGVFGLVFFIVMMIISTIHTGRKIFTNFYLNLGIILIFISTFIRALIPYYESYSVQAYMISSVLWAIPFIIYIKIFFPFLISKRFDGIPG